MTQMNYYIKKRNIALAILFTIITCGIYELYWIYKLTEETNIVAKKTDETSPGMVVLFYIITCGIYGVYWAYKQGEKFRDYDYSVGRNDSENYPILFLILFIASYFTAFLSLIGMAIMQDKLNKISDANSFGRTQGPYEWTSTFNTDPRTAHEPKSEAEETNESSEESSSNNATIELGTTEYIPVRKDEE